jgi:hypothetical protein
MDANNKPQRDVTAYEFLRRLVKIEIDFEDSPMMHGEERVSVTLRYACRDAKNRSRVFRDSRQDEVARSTEMVAVHALRNISPILINKMIHHSINRTLIYAEQKMREEVVEQFLTAKQIEECIERDLTPDSGRDEGSPLEGDDR